MSRRRSGKDRCGSERFALIRYPLELSIGGLLQPRVLRLGLLQDGDVGVGVFPEGKKENLCKQPVLSRERHQHPPPARLLILERSHVPCPDAPTLLSSSSRRCRCGREFSGTRQPQPCPVPLPDRPVPEDRSDR